MARHLLSSKQDSQQLVTVDQAQDRALAAKDQGLMENVLGR